MTAVASFQVEVTPDDAIAFARLSGDWNPLHTDSAHASRTAYRRPVLHGAFSAGLVSRMAGMYLPGTDCLLHGMRLRFASPIVPPAALAVEGKVVADNGQMGHVDVRITDATTAALYVEASYEFSRHDASAQRSPVTLPNASSADSVASVLVTGATGGLGAAVLQRLGGRALGTSRSPGDGLLTVPDLECIAEVVGDRRVSAIVHCAWPAPDNQRLTSLANIRGAIEHNLSAPVRQVLALAQFLVEHGTDGAPLILVGSAFARPGRHGYRMPLYTLSKSLIPDMTRILALELASKGRRCVSITFDVIDGGMNKRLSPALRAMHADRTPTGKLPTAADVAGQIEWVLDNASFLASGATIDLTGGAIP